MTAWLIKDCTELEDEKSAGAKSLRLTLEPQPNPSHYSIE